MHAFFFGIWGKEHSGRFKIFTAPCLIINFKNLDQRLLKKIKIEIWIPQEDYKNLRENNNFKELKKIVKVNIVIIDKFLKLLKQKSKYHLLSLMHNIFITTHALKFKYLWFIYPDFIFNQNLIKKIILQMKKSKADAFLMPVPQVISERVEKIFLNKKINKINMNNLISNNLHQNNFICDLENLNTGSPPFLYVKNKDRYLLKGFHIHPIVIDTEQNLMEISDIVYPTIDEGFSEKIAEKNILIPKSQKFGICASVHNLDYVSINKKKFNIRDFSFFYMRHITKAHVKFSKTIYEFGNSKSRISSQRIKKLKNFQKERLNDIYSFELNFNSFKNETKRILKIFLSKFKLGFFDIVEVLKEEEKFREFYRNNKILDANQLIYKHLIASKDKKKRTKLIELIIKQLSFDKNFHKTELNFLKKIYKQCL